MSVILSVNNIAKSFGEDVLFSDVSFIVEENEKVAFVGPNGCGKSTLFHIITGKEEADGGTVSIASDVTVGLLEQYQDDKNVDDIYAYVLQARSDILAMEEKLKNMEKQMAGQAGNDTNRLFEEYHSLSHIYETEGGQSYRSEVTGVLKGLGFCEDDFHKSMQVLSGGQKTRVNLARLLLTKPDLLLLDEPINHLDLSSIEWLEGYLKNYRKTVVIVAHDRYFLDRIVGKVIDLSAKKAKSYQGNYTDFVDQKALWQTSIANAYEKQQKEIAHEEAVIGKLKQFNRQKSIKRAESRQKKLEKIVPLDAPEKARDTMRITLGVNKVSGKDVLKIDCLSKEFDGKRLFGDLSFQIYRNERVAVIGDNGCGKTTLLKIINEVIPPDQGSVTIGANVSIGYYDQEQQNLDENKTLFDELSDAYVDLTGTKIRNVLAAFLFKADDVYKRIGDLSGGERGRISLCKLMLSGANFLILDEPTNHLDMESKEILENAITSYEGTVLYVSHDRYFVNQTATRILEMTSTYGLTEFQGNYDYYIEKRDTIRRDYGDRAASFDTGTVAGDLPPADRNEDAKVAWQKRKEEAAKEKKRKQQIAETESAIEKTETEIAAIDEQFLDEEIAKNSAKLNELSAKQNELRSHLDALYEEWEKLQYEE